MKFLFSIYKIIFQNLFSKLYKNINDDKIIQILLIIINNNKESSELNILWAVKILKYYININKEIIQNLLNSSAEINMILYNIILKLELVIQLNVIIMIKDAENLKLSFIRYISDMIIKIEDVIIK